MTIKEVAEKYDITPDTLRYYERIKMIPEVTRTAGGIRDYQESDLQWVEREFLNALPKWEGDQIFLDLLWQNAPFFLLTLRYHGDTLTEAILNGEKIR